jgi:hypothetical protein
VAAERTGDFKPGAVENSDIASHMMPEGDVVPAVQLEFPALDAFKEPAKRIGLLVLAFLFHGHDKGFLFLIGIVSGCRLTGFCGDLGGI